MPNPPRARRKPAFLLAVVVASVSALLATTMSSPALATTRSADRAATAPAAAAKPAKPRDREFRAHRALARAQKALSPTTRAAERPDATLALRNLWLLKDALPAAERAAAEKLGQRPSKPATIGDANILVHYDPAQMGYDINQAMASLTYVADTYAASGYRRPKSDGTKGGDARTDIYIDTLEPGLYGYCTTDQKKPVKPGRYDVWAYCVVDNDYAGFPLTPIQNLQVTAAHEFYHAVQFAYDIAEDGWFMEATAAWAEDELYDDVNDNLQYLRASPITRPSRSIDKFEDGGVFHYGVWNFFRFLSERYPTDFGAMPALLLKMWQYADSSKGARKDKYSTQAVNKALRKTGRTTLAEQFTDYSAATRLPQLYFNEAAALGYPVKGLAGSASLKKRKSKTFRTKLDHLTSATFRVTPNGTKSGSKLKVGVDMANRSAGSRAIVVTYFTNGAVSTKVVKLNARGNRAKKFAFGSDAVAAVEVTLVNASTRYRNCYQQDTPFACSGRPVDDDLRGLVRLTALR